MNSHDTLVLLEQLVGELGENLQEGQVGWRTSWVQRIFQRVHRKEDTLAM